MAFFGRLLGLMGLSVGVWFVPFAMLVCGGSLSWLIPISQGVPRTVVLLCLLLLPPVMLLFLAVAAVRMIEKITGSDQVVLNKERSPQLRQENKGKSSGFRGLLSCAGAFGVGFW